VKLLLDQNISRRVAAAFDVYGLEIRHVSFFGLESATDRHIWDFAKDRGYAIVSKDADFHHMSFTFGAPPKTIWLKLGNCSTREITVNISRNLSAIAAFVGDADSSLMVITPVSIETDVKR
jgi:predicted nuclease of predicted toxin-antitoxin system